MVKKGLDQIIQAHKPDSLSFEDRYKQNHHHTSMFAIVSIVGIVGIMSAIMIFTYQDIGPGQAYQVAIDSDLYVSCKDATVYDCSTVSKLKCEQIVDASNGDCIWGIG